MNIKTCLAILVLMVVSTAGVYGAEASRNVFAQHNFPSTNKLRFGITEAGWMPFIGADEQNRLIGISGDITRDFSRKHNIDLELVKYPNFPELMEALVSREIDFASDIVPTVARQRDYAFTKHYLKSHQGIITHQNSQNLSSLDELDGKTVAIETGFFRVKEMREQHPEISLILVDATEEALRLISNKKADAYVGNLEVANYLISRELIPNLRVATTLQQQTKTLSFAVRPDNLALVNLLDKYLAESVNADAIAGLRLKWELGNFQPVARYQELLNRTMLSISLIVIVFAVLIFWIRKMRAMIVERNKVQEQLESSKRDLVHILDSIHQGLVKIDANHQISYVNKKAYSYFGMNPGRVENKEFLQLAEEQMDRFELPRELRTKAYEVVNNNIYAEFRLRNDISVIDICHLPLKNGEALVIYTDVTKRVFDEEALHRETQKASAAAEAKSNFLANMSHEIRTPLNGVLGMLEILEYSELNLEQRRYVGEVRGSANSLLTIINDILDFSKLEAGEMKLSLREGSILHSVEKVCSTLAPLALRKGLKFYLDVDPDIATVIHFDDTRLEQILFNLIGNAIKFTSNGFISLRVELESEQESLQRISFSVKDTGVGIEPSKLTTLFSPFIQAEENTNRRFGGTGLGLSICKKIADAMDAELTIDSQKSIGTEARFSVLLRKSFRDVDKTLDLRGIKFNVCTTDQHVNGTISRYLINSGADVREYEFSDLLHMINQEENDSICIVNQSVWSNKLIQEILIERAYPVINLITEPTINSLESRDSYIELQTNPLSKSLFENVVRYILGLSILECTPSDNEITEVKALKTISDAIIDNELILLVEDHAINREVLLKQLNLLGLTVEIAKDGIQGLRAWETDRYRLIIADCHMPEMDGYDMIRNIRMRENEGQHIPIIALTASALEGEREKCLSAGADDYIAKPANIAQLKSLLSRWMKSEVSIAGTSIDVESVVVERVNENVYEQVNLGPDRKALLELFSEVELRGLIADFSQTIEEDSCDLNEAVFFMNRLNLKKYAHRIKSACRAVYVDQIARVAEKIELNADSGDWDDLQVIVNKFNALVDRLKFVIQEEFV